MHDDVNPKNRYKFYRHIVDLITSEQSSHSALLILTFLSLLLPLNSDVVPLFKVHVLQFNANFWNHCSYSSLVFFCCCSGVSMQVCLLSQGLKFGEECAQSEKL